VNVSSIAVMDWCRQNGVLYLDTCIEPWEGYYNNPEVPAEERTNYFLRHTAVENGKTWPARSPSAIVTHGANPGLISHFVKAALLEVARDVGLDAEPASKADWAALARRTGTKVIHVAEHDTQISSRPKRLGEFVNTWSVPGFWGEGSQPAELGWGTHEKRLPEDARRHKVGSRCAIYLNRPGCTTEVRSWTPIGGPLIGFCITHGESITLSDYLTVWEDGRAVYRPTVHYAYHPCDDAVLSLHEMAGRAWRPQEIQRLLMEEITSGMDELGVLLMGHERGAFWYGSQLTIEQARALAPFNSATSLQVAAGVLGGMVWAIEHPNAGIVEADDLDFRRVLEVARPYLGPVVGAYTDWTPLDHRPGLFAENLDPTDPWQFKNVLVA
jgi:homospermidine synthase